MARLTLSPKLLMAAVAATAITAMAAPGLASAQSAYVTYGVTTYSRGYDRDHYRDRDHRYGQWSGYGQRWDDDDRDGRNYNWDRDHYRYNGWHRSWDGTWVRSWDNSWDRDGDRRYYHHRHHDGDRWHHRYYLDRDNCDDDGDDCGN